MLIDRSRRYQDESGDRIFAPELNRLLGEVLLANGSADGRDVEQCYQEAISLARSQSAKSWELRAVTSLARFWQSQSKTTEARDLLAPIYGWFTEGFDTADLKEAKSLLDELH